MRLPQVRIGFFVTRASRLGLVIVALLFSACGGRSDEMPPAQSFWSLSMYKQPEQLFIHNPVDRYSIGDRTEGLQYGEDGSLTVYIQAESPGVDMESNWLPAFDGPFALTMRIYWPEPDALDPLYVPPAIEKVR